jgi:hypothetical protein
VFYRDAHGLHPNLRAEPETGKALIFKHTYCHQGERVQQGVKYILRTDIMFKRTDKPLYSTYKPFLDNPLFIKAMGLYDKSIELQAKGDPKGKMKYNKRKHTIHICIFFIIRFYRMLSCCLRNSSSSEICSIGIVIR